ncbi:putative von willebrand domain-containing protein [Rosellinia necatrix]|uniref:Putative von willebrand domain-containing protein n=1 Tax=Rosellinia necatrix TaxID=77044 RepID=A0A1W2THU8_ROSNE|nr:putative von willebrand domain-containing protein [Rosellinia necatrix]
MRAHTVIKDVASRTVLTQTFSNDSDKQLKDIVYSFPLYDGVSVVSFFATIGDVKIHGIVKEKQQARREYHEAVDKGSSAGLLEQLPEASDVFVTRIGNVPAGAKVIVDIVYIGELRHDAESNGSRFTIPSSIAPRYGTTPDDVLASSELRTSAGAIQVVIDFQSPEGCPIQQIQSPSHPITVNVGRTTDMPATAYMINRGSATLSLDTATLDNDFVIIANIKDADTPKALIETHPTMPNQRALMTTLVPRFGLPPTYGEIVFIVDRSGSMGGKMDMVIRAMSILLKSLPVGTKFNICSFGSHHSFLWPRSKSYDDANLNEALKHIDTFDANFGGTEMYNPVQATISQRFSDMLLDAIILTDGEIWSQDVLFDLIRTASADNKCRFFSLGIGSGASTALVEGIAIAGNGFSQFVAEGEKMDKKMVRLLKGALTPHIDDYSLQVKYKESTDDFEIIDSVDAALNVDVTTSISVNQTTPKSPISLFDDKIDVDSSSDTTMIPSGTGKNKFAHLPIISLPSILQAPSRVPPLYPFSRTTVYLLLDQSTYHKTPESVILRATCAQGPLELEIKVEDIGKGETIHQLAAKKAISEIEKSGGWLAAAADKVDGILIKNKYEGRWEEIIEREAVRLGTDYQIAGKWCSFIALEGDVEHDAVVFGGEMESSPEVMRRKMAAPGGFSPSVIQPAVGSSMSFGRSSGALEQKLKRATFFGQSSPTTRKSMARESTSSSSTFGSAVSGSPATGNHTPPGSSFSLFGSQSQTSSPPGSPAAGSSVPFGQPSPRFRRMQSPMAPIALSQQSEGHSPSKPNLVTKLKMKTGFLKRSQPPAMSDESDESTEDGGIQIDEDKMHRIIRLQKSDGSWDCSQDLLGLLGISLDSKKRTAIVATALAVSFLQTRMGHEAASWELIVDKAKNWLGQQGGLVVEKEISDAEKLLT